ncbi:MAG: glycosyltransferase family 4 protein [Calditrichaeota bacterium]|nr:glycosyltransferase family 4 protein [Calditrichota bacterium]
MKKSRKNKTKLNNKIKVAHVQLLPIMSGVQRAMFDILLRLDRQKFDLLVICQNEGELTENLKKNNIDYFCIPALKREIHPLYDVVAFFKLVRILKKEGVQIIHTHSSKPGMLGRFAASVAGVKVRIHTVQGFAFHEFSDRQKVFLLSLAERLAGLVSDKIIFVNNKDYLFARENKLAAEQKLVQIPNGIELNGSVELKNIRKELGFEDSVKLVGSVGRLWKQKAPQYFILAIPEVIEKHPQARFVLTGDGPLERELRELAAKLGVEKYVRFLGWRKDAKRVLAEYDVFVQTSLWEGLSLSIMEAMAAAKPVVASDIKGNNELVVDGKTGFLVPPKQPKDLADKINFLLDQPALRKKMGAAGRLRMEKNFAIEQVADKIENLYLTLISQN